MRPADLYEPVGYSPVWAIVAASVLAAVLVYFAVVLWLTRAPRPVSVSRERRRHLRRLSGVVRDVGAGALSAREGHQQVSVTVRSFAEAVGSWPASSMTLGSLRPVVPEELTELLDFLYEPAFSGDEVLAVKHFDTSVERAREVLSSWT